MQAQRAQQQHVRLLQYTRARGRVAALHYSDCTPSALALSQQAALACWFSLRLAHADGLPACSYVRSHSTYAWRGSVCGSVPLNESHTALVSEAHGMAHGASLQPQVEASDWSSRIAACS